jgi:DNA-binding NtrC family response regulator
VSERLRSFWLPALAVAYVCFAAVQASGTWPAYLALVGLPLLIAEAWRKTRDRPHGEDALDVGARKAIRACVWGTAIWVAARTGPAGRPGFDAAANLGAGICSVAALVTLARIPGIGGLLTPRPATRSLDAAAFAALLWGIAVALPATRALMPSQRVLLDPLAIDYATTSAGLGSLLVLIAATWRLRALRRLELGVSERAGGALALAITAFVVAVPAAALDVAPPDRVLPIAVILASLSCAWCAMTKDSTLVASALRGVLAVMILGTPVTLLAGLIARGASEHAGAVVLATALICIVVGLIARAVARPLGPEQSRWLDAIDAASRGALQPEPDAAIRAALVALSGATSTPGARPELWRNDPEEVLSVDIAGYLHVDKAQAPERLYELAQQEPERTLRAEVLGGLEVRRPEVRPLLAWFETRRAFSATLVLDEEGPSGFILLPRGNRGSVMTLEEARAVRVLADRISALLSVSSALARSRERELSAIARADTVDDERQRLEHIIGLGGERNRAIAERAARNIRAAAYSPAARIALERLDRLGRFNASIVLITAPGIDPTGWAAVAHLASPRGGGPFIVIDATDGSEHALARWEHEDESPLALADGGSLFIRDAHALPLAVQEYIANYLSRREKAAPRSSILAASLMVSLSAPAARLIEQGLLSDKLARWTADAEVVLPALVDRAEDLRALILSHVAKAAQSRHGRPLGIEPAALRLLLEHDWPGNEIELADVVIRATQLATGDALRAADLAAVGFSPHPRASAIETPLPAPSNRPSRRPRPMRRR